MPLDPAAEAIVDELLDLYRAAQADLIDELVQAAADTTTTSATYRSRLAGLARAVTEELATLDASARTWASSRLPEVYQLGAGQGAADVGARFDWTLIHREAVRQLAADTFDDLLAATRYVRRDVKAFIRLAARERARAVLLQGDTATRAGRRLSTLLEQRNIAAVTYKNGARHSLRDYADVAIRTKTALAYSGGQLNLGREFGIEWVQVNDGAGCGWEAHDSTDLANGSVRTLAEAEAYPISHPRCARSFSLLPVATRREAQRIAAGDLSDVRTVEPLAPRTPAHRRRLEQRQARLAARAAKLR